MSDYRQEQVNRITDLQLKIADLEDDLEEARLDLDIYDESVRQEKAAVAAIESYMEHTGMTFDEVVQHLRSAVQEAAA